MKGSYQIIIQNRRIRYDFTIRRNITIIRGDSASGKTQLIELLLAFERRNGDSGVTLSCDKACVVLGENRWEENLKLIHDSIVFIDEGADYVATDLFSRAVAASDNYYVIITRHALPNLPYSVEEIYGIRISEKYAGLKQTYNEFYHLYGNVGEDSVEDVQSVIVEDSNAGFAFFSEAVNHSVSISSANGKSSIPESVRCLPEEEIVLVVADGAAFGSEMERMERLILTGRRIAMYLPESFEWIILRSGLIEDGEVEAVLACPEKTIDSAEYLSWEQFFTAFLVKKTEGTYLKYSKSRLNPAYLQKKERMAIKNVMQVIRGVMK